MDWTTGQPELAPGSLIQFRSGSRGKRYRIIRTLGKGQSFVYEGEEVLPVDTEETPSNRPDAVAVEESVVPTPSIISDAVDAGESDAVDAEGSLVVTPSKRPLLSVDRTPSGRFTKKLRSVASSSPTKAGKKRAVPLTASVPKSVPNTELSPPSWSSIAKATSSPGPSTTSLVPRTSPMAAATSFSGSSTANLSSRPPLIAVTKSCSSSNHTVAIKLQYTTAKTHRPEVAQGKAMGQLGYEWDVMTDIQQKVGEGVITAGLCCGWVEIKLPFDEVWTIGLFAALVMPIYQEFDSINKTPELFLSAIQSLREVHSAGYVHGDIKPANFLVDGENVLVSDVESAMRLGTPLAADYAATPFYQFLPYLAHRLNCHGANKSKLVRSVSTTVTDRGMDFWAVGIMLLEEYYPEYLEVHFPLGALMEKLEVKQVAELEAKVLEEMRCAFSQLYDEHAYEGYDVPNAADADNADAHAKVPDSIKALLRYCIRRPADCGLLGRNESTPVELAGILEKMELEVDTTEEVAASAGIGSSTSSPATRKKQRKKQPSGVIRNRAEYKQTGSAWEEIVLDKSRRHPVRLPHGDCRLAWDESAGRFAMDVPGILEEKKRTYIFTQCPVDHAVGYEQVRPRYVCGNCEYRTYGWPATQKHIQACDKGAKAEKLIGETN